MELQVFNAKANGWRKIRTAETNNRAEAYEYLVQQMNEWRQNCNDWRTAEFRIGSYSYPYGEEPKFVVYEPEKSIANAA